MVMNLQRRKFPRQNTNMRMSHLMKRQSGQVNWTAGVFLMLFVAVFLFAALQVERFKAASVYAEDALAASNLASALVDLREYGISHRVLIADPQEAYGRYCAALKENLNLDSEWRGAENSVVPGVVTVENYTVYNVDGGSVWVYQFGHIGEAVWEEQLGVAKAPNGMLIEDTSVYSQICFDVSVMWGGKITAHKGKLAVVRRENE